ncbi:MAG: TIGR04086 family membrane protein [Clostridia bacterium]|nr:TIGR04086 family membrane protein [Clostridia bacterium]
MDKSIASHNTGTRKKKSGISGIIRATIVAGLVFTLCMLIIPLLLVNTATPENYISAAAVCIVALTAFSAALTAQLGSDRHFLMTGIVTALCIVLILVSASLIFGKNDQQKNFLFSAILYATGIISSIVGAKIASGRGNKKK